MPHRSLTIHVLASALFLTACQTSVHPNTGRAAESATTARDAGYALLYSTIGQECDVDKVLIIKSPAPAVSDLVKAIGQFARDAKATMENLSREDRPITLDNQGLPEVETTTREAIGSTTSRQILFHGGKDLEFRLLLTQHEALNYITHLAASVADHEPRDNRRRYLGQLSTQSDALHERVLSLLKTPYIGQAQ